MRDTYFGARLKDENTINVCVFSNYQKPIDSPINLIINETKYQALTISRQSFLNGLVIFECKTKEPIVLGNSYSVVIKDYGITPLIVEDALNFPNFDRLYYYNGNDLGFTYNKNETTFKLWAPLASKVVILIRKESSETFKTFPLKRGKNGVYSLTLKGDFDGYKYRYRVTNNGISVISTDPYGKASTANGKDSVVIDFNKTKIDLNNDKLPHLLRYSDAIIYELSIRDFTIDDSTNIINKGKYLGLVEKNNKTSGNNPCGFDYLKDLGITHIQVLPIFDFKTTDELNIKNTYNWGYDPQQYFVPEGSYSTNPNDPYSRIIELKTMISELHKVGIKVNMDVVFNHVYEEQFSSFEKIVPGYYFRKRKNGTLSNGSYCGNDLDTKRPMVRKLIIDACKFWMEEYGIDGYRFDLMGIIDIETMQQVLSTCRAIRPDCMIYGEGWDMNTELLNSEKTTIYNSFKTPDFAFFNDTFRDIVRGKNEGNDGGYFLGDTSYREGFKFSFLGSSLNYCYSPRFLSVNQSINYAECHDNRTLYDRILACFGNNIKDEDIFDTIKAINAIIAFSYGISFYHAGQEIGLSKNGCDNSYNKGDEINKFNWKIFDKRQELVSYFKSILNFKNKIFKYNLIKNEEIEKNVDFIDLSNGGVLIYINLNSHEYENIIIAINPTFNSIPITLEDYYRVVVANAGANLNSSIYTQSFILGPHELNVLMKKKVED